MPKQTPSQTVGPYFRIGLYSDNDLYPRILTGEMVTPDVAGQRIRVQGTVFDGAGDPIPDCMLEVWQADGEGRFRTADEKWNDGFTGFGRVGTDDVGQFTINTIMPGRVPGPDGTQQAPHLSLIVYMRGLLLHAFTRSLLRRPRGHECGRPDIEAGAGRAAADDHRAQAVRAGASGRLSLRPSDAGRRRDGVLRRLSG